VNGSGGGQRCAREVAVGALGTVYALSAASDGVAEALAPVLAQGWSLASDSATQRNGEAMEALGLLAAEVSLAAEGKIAADAQQLSAYCAASVQAPHEAITSFFDPRRWFGIVVRLEPSEKIRSG
jgi:hypothetical protein